MNRNNSFGCMLIVVSLFFSAGEVFAESKITADLRRTIDQVMEIVADPNLKSNPVLKREKLRQVIGLRFNFKQMVMRSLAKNYKDLSDEERKEFTLLFKKLLENSYASKIENYKNEKVKYIDEKIKGKYAMVRTQIVRKDGVVDVDYKMLNDGGQWLVYDFVIEGVSLIRNYKSQFSKIISTESYAALLSKLSKKVNELEAKSNADSDNL